MPATGSAPAPFAPPVLGVEDLAVLAHLRAAFVVLTELGDRRDWRCWDAEIILSWQPNGLRVLRHASLETATRLAQACRFELDSTLWFSLPPAERKRLSAALFSAVSTAVLPRGLPPGLLALLQTLRETGSVDAAARAAVVAAGWRLSSAKPQIEPEPIEDASAHELLELLVLCQGGGPDSAVCLAPLAPFLTEAAARLAKRAATAA